METNILEVGAGLNEGSIVARGRSAALLLDFAVAFRSLRHRWIFAALRRMRIPQKVINLVEAMCHDMKTTLVFAGEAVGALALEAGVRQGCPLSGKLFALAVDPLLRVCLASATLRSTRLSLLVDDLAVMLMRIVELEALMAALTAWAPASGMTLIERTCVVLPTSMSTDTTRGMLQRVGLLTNAMVVTSARYLGVAVGIDAHVRQWESVAPKVARRPLVVMASTQGIASRLRLSNSHVATMLLHRGRFRSWIARLRPRCAMPCRATQRRPGWRCRQSCCTT